MTLSLTLACLSSNFAGYVKGANFENSHFAEFSRVVLNYVTQLPGPMDSEVSSFIGDIVSHVTLAFKQPV